MFYTIFMNVKKHSIIGLNPKIDEKHCCFKKTSFSKNTVFIDYMPCWCPNGKMCDSMPPYPHS
jgi:hypothetical protein